MKKLTLLFFVAVMTVNGLFAQGTEKEKAVQAYYSGFETHNWDLVASQLADGFTFTTPVNDHISVKEFKDSCWGTNRFTKKVNLIKMVQSGNDLILLVEIHTTDNKLARNVDIYTFSEGKIKSIEVFFGPGLKYPGNTN
ncbi:MAG TPA: nuclear transport factor 2 family protein [Chitinophagaceae bacterium]